jgi:hypothetical protein
MIGVPFLRPATVMGALAKPTPDGWTTQAVGAWRGRAVEVVFDDRRHDIAVVRCAGPRITAGLANAGWHLRGRDGEREWWVRDRVVVARERVARHRAIGRMEAVGR